VRSGSDHVLAVDIGGTKLAAAVINRAGAVIHRDQTATSGADEEELYAALLRLIDGVREAADVDIAGVGVGCGGPMERGGIGVSPLNIPQWRHFALRPRLEATLDLPVTVDNDAKALALAEGWVGAARGERDFLAMVVSTGVGGGIVLDGRLLDGSSSNAGHIGHVVVVPGGRRCACGGHGCLEAEASGTAIAAITGRPAAAADHAVRVRTGQLVGQAVASVANLLDLRLACVAGSVALGFGDVFFAAAQAEIDASARLEFSRGTRMIRGGLGHAGPLVGAAALAWRTAGLDIGIG
jgi:glucokinase